MYTHCNIHLASSRSCTCSSVTVVLRDAKSRLQPGPNMVYSRSQDQTGVRVSLRV